CQQHKSHPFTF
nr:immunoglobulin light chain junction region [Macaca mulatta]